MCQANPITSQFVTEIKFNDIVWIGAIFNHFARDISVPAALRNAIFLMKPSGHTSH
jgi:hypothetical protein